MNRFRTYIFTLLFLFVLVAPATTRAQVNESEYRALLLQLIASLQQQIELLRAQLEERQSVVTTPAAMNEGGILSSSVDMVAVYQIAGVGGVANITNRSHRAYFSRLYELFPVKYEQKLSRLGVFDGTDASFDAFVETVPPRHESWMYAISEEMLDDPRSDWNTELIIHELSHIISYETAGGATVSAGYSCDGYFETYGCPPAGSYLGRFITEFWSASDIARAERFADADDEYESAYAYYERHQSDYVSDYAAVAPEEDFAESFLSFMSEETVPPGLAREKVAFFARYPDLLGMREEVAKSR